MFRVTLRQAGLFGQVLHVTATLPDEPREAVPPDSLGIGVGPLRPSILSFFAIGKQTFGRPPLMPI
jgi:hypothetical protein